MSKDEILLQFRSMTDYIVARLAVHCGEACLEFSSTQNTFLNVLAEPCCGQNSFNFL